MCATTTARAGAFAFACEERPRKSDARCSVCLRAAARHAAVAVSSSRGGCGHERWLTTRTERAVGPLLCILLRPTWTRVVGRHDNRASTPRVPGRSTM
jgi:hypothetical protein